MTMSMNRKVIKFEEGCTVMQKCFMKLKNLLEGVPEKQFDPAEYMTLYTTIYNMCTQRSRIRSVPLSELLYSKYKESFAEYISTMVLPALRERHNEFLLREFVKRWDNHKIMVLWLSHFFNYLDLYFIPRNSLPSLDEVSRKCFLDQVYAEMKNDIKDAAISLIHGGEIDRALLKNVAGVFMEIGAGVEAYESDFELAILTAGCVLD